MVRPTVPLHDRSHVLSGSRLMMKAICKVIVGLALSLFVLPAWAGSIGLQIKPGGTLSVNTAANIFSGTGKLLDFSSGNALFPAVGSFLFVTGRPSCRMPYA